MRPGPNSGQGHPGSSAEQEFMQRRPELFFPYLPPFFNGLPPKVRKLGFLGGFIASFNSFSKIDYKGACYNAQGHNVSFLAFLKVS